MAGLPTLCFRKVWKFGKVLDIRRYLRPQVCPGTGGASWVGALFLFLSEVTEIFLQNRVKTLEFEGACWWFCDGCAKKLLVLSLYKKSSRKVCSITKSLRSQTKVWKLVTLFLGIIDFTETRHFLCW